MDTFCFWLFAATLSVVLIRGLISPLRFYEYPYFMSGIFAIFILPQALSLLRFPGATSPEAVTGALLMTALCLLACLLGYLIPPNRWIQSLVTVPLRPDRLFAVSIIFIAASYYFSFLIFRMSEMERGGSNWTGKVTIYFFFAQLGFPGLAIAFGEALRTGKLVPWVFTILGALLPAITIVFAGRREITAILLLTIGLTLFYQRGLVPPRLAVAAVLIFATLAIPATGAYRQITKEQNWKELKRIDIVSNFKQFLNQESILELRNAANIIDAIESTGNYGFGSGYWDRLVFRFIPAQLVGKATKNAMMFNPSDEHLNEQLRKRRYRIWSGTTFTGMGDSFRQFGYFGCLVFAAIAVISRSLWVASLHRQAIFAQLFYIQVFSNALKAVTHETSDYPAALVYNSIFLGLAAWYARDRRTPRFRVRTPLSLKHIQDSRSGVALPTIS